MRLMLVLLAVISSAGVKTGVECEEAWEPEPATSVIASTDTTIPAETGVVGTAAKLSLGVYRLFLSEQQEDVCVFRPSCSEYALQAIDSCGAIIGLLMIADRLERCNWTALNYAPRYYAIDIAGGRAVLLDPIGPNSPQGELRR
jgi:putative component of membrane protein insertase Oxa1/YidC/SpoIIIJ protein YidD